MSTYPSIPVCPGAYWRPKGTKAGTAILFHGYKGNGAQMIDMFHEVAGRMNIALIAPDANSDQWGAHAGSPDMLRATKAMDWAAKEWNLAGAKNVASCGHSFGTRMAAVFGTTDWRPTKIALAHGRFVPADLGKHKVPALFTGSELDNQFDFKVMQGQYRSWPGGAELEAFPGNHYPQAQELSAIGHFILC